MAGLLTQAMVRNSLGEPYILGLPSGAGVGEVSVLTTVGAGIARLLTLPRSAFRGAKDSSCSSVLAGLGRRRSYGRCRRPRTAVSHRFTA